MRIALYQPDIPQNAGAIIRLAACLGVPVDLIEPFGFVWSDARLRRAGMDYLAQADVTRHASWRAFRAAGHARLVLLTRHARLPYTGFDFRAGDVLLLGQESAGAPEEVHAAAAARVTVPLRTGLRSMNVATAAAMVLGEALRQTGGFPPADEAHAPEE